VRVLEYSPVAEHLLVELPGFPRYEVFDLPESTFADWQRSMDQTSYFNDNIWGSRYEHNSHWSSLHELLHYIEENFYFESAVTVASRAGDGDTPLHLATVWGDVGAVELLVAAGAEVDARGDMECTPLYNAATFGHFRCAALLLQAGANPDLENGLATSARKAGLQSKNPKLRALLSSEA